MYLIAVVVPVVGGMHYYLYSELVSTLGPMPDWVLWLLRALVILEIFSFPFLRVLARNHIARPTVAIDWAVVVWLGLFLYSFVATIALRAAAEVASLAGLWPAGASLLGPVHEGLAVTAVGVLTLGVATFGLVRARALPRTTEIEIPLPRLSSSLDGFTLVQLSDLHLGPFTTLGRFQKIVEQVNRLRPDLVVITGDLVDEAP